MIPGMCPAHALDLRFAERELRRVRAIQAGTPDAGIGGYRSSRCFREIRRLCRMKGGVSAPIRIPGTPGSRLRQQQGHPVAVMAGVGSGNVRRGRSSEPSRIDGVRLLASGSPRAPIELQGMDAAGRWHTIPVQPFASSIPVTENLRAAAVRALLDRGIRYLLVSPGTLGANDFHTNARAWGILQIGESGGTQLYRLKTDGASSPRRCRRHPL